MPARDWKFRVEDIITSIREILDLTQGMRGEPGAESDLDFLVVQPTVRDRRREMVRLRRVLSPLRIPADVIVVSEQAFQEWRDTPGNILYEAAVEGRVLYEAA
jgi:hypothetical protein